MEEYKDILIPLVIAVITVIVTAIITIQIKHSATKEDAYGGLKLLASKALYFAWVAYLIFSLFLLASSNDPLTRGDVFSISIITVCLALLLMLHFLNRLISIIKIQMKLHRDQVDLFEKHMQIHYSEEKDKSNNK